MSLGRIAAWTRRSLAIVACGFLVASAVAAAAAASPQPFAATAPKTISLPSDAGMNPTALAGRIACPSLATCLLVGTFSDGSSALRGFSSLGSLGKWSRGTEIEAPRNANSDPGVSLDALSCPSSSTCVAAGSYTDSTIGGSPMVVNWSDGQWSRGVELSLPGDQNTARSSALSAISCAAPGSCTAVGNYINSIDEILSISSTERGGRWTLARVIAPPDDLGAAAGEPSYAGADGFTLLNDMSCATSTTCVAVGEYSSERHGQIGLLATLHAGRWTERPAPLPGDAASNPAEVLNAVSCRTDLCVAVGYYTSRHGTQPLVELEQDGHWESPEHVTLPPGARAGALSELDSVACASTSWCVGVGEYTAGTGARLAMALAGIPTKWGQATSIAVPSDAATDPIATLDTVTCTATAHCVAAGSYENDRDTQQAFVVSP